MKEILSVRYALMQTWGVFKTQLSHLTIITKACTAPLLAAALIFGLVASHAQAKTLNLVGNKVATYIDEHQLPARQITLVSAALPTWEVTTTATTQAWSGSGLKSGKFSGYIDHYSLNQASARYVYSEPYLEIHLHVASRYQKAESIIRLEQLYRERVGIENRFANTDQLRGERDVRWARAPTFFDNMKQLAEERVDYLFVDKAMVDEMNLLLASVGEKPIYLSKQPLITVQVSLAMNKDADSAQAVISDFNSGIETLKASGQYLTILDQSEARTSLLDEPVYTEMLRKW